LFADMLGAITVPPGFEKALHGLLNAPFTGGNLQGADLDLFKAVALENLAPGATVPEVMQSLSKIVAMLKSSLDSEGAEDQAAEMADPALLLQALTAMPPVTADDAEVTAADVAGTPAQGQGDAMPTTPAFVEFPSEPAGQFGLDTGNATNVSFESMPQPYADIAAPVTDIPVSLTDEPVLQEAVLTDTAPVPEAITTVAESVEQTQTVAASGVTDERPSGDIQEGPDAGETLSLSRVARSVGRSAQTGLDNAAVDEVTADAAGEAPPETPVAENATIPVVSPIAEGQTRPFVEAAQGSDIAIETVPTAGPLADAPLTREATETAATPALSPDQERVIARISRAITQVSNEGRTTVRVRLYPPELGTVKVEVSSFRGQVTARVEASTEAASRLIQMNMGALRADIRAAGVDLRSMDVEYSNPSAQYNLADRRGGQPGYSQPRQSRNQQFRESFQQAPRSTEFAAAASGALDLLL
jgi:flagellar hook-length control protein FliK